MCHYSLDLYDYTARMTPITKSILEKLKLIATDLSNQYTFTERPLSVSSDGHESEIIIHRGGQITYVRLLLSGEIIISISRLGVYHTVNLADPDSFKIFRKIIFDEYFGVVCFWSRAGYQDD